MTIDRRTFLALGLAGLAAPSLTARAAPMRLHALAFDGLVVFDVRRAAGLAEAYFPGKGQALLNAWRTRQFEYQWLRAVGERYADFLEVTRDSLEFAAHSLGLTLDSDSRAALLNVWLELDPWPEAGPALRALKDAGLRLAFLSNMTAKMLNDGIERGGLVGLFDLVLSTDEAKCFKPAPKAYALGPSALGLPIDSILFVASAGWDAAGAKWSGYPTYWLNRAGGPEEELDAQTDGAGRSMEDLVRFVGPHLRDARAENRLPRSTPDAGVRFDLVSGMNPTARRRSASF